MTTYRLRSGDLVTSKDGSWPTQYTNRTQAARAAAKIDGAEVIVRGRPFYVRVPEVACESCKKLVAPDEGKTLDVQTARQTHGSPAEYDEQFICHPCIDRAEYEHENADYLWARARGWAD